MRILIADDDPVARRVLEKHLLDWSYEVTTVADGNEAWKAFQAEDAPRLAILDWMMPGMDGVQICEAVRKLKHEEYTYLILLTVRESKEDVVRGLDAGADDYLTKPFDAQELKARLRTGRRILALQGALLSAREALRSQVTLDPLTGLWNRSALLATLKREVARAAQQATALTVFKVDIDHFERINETRGYLEGDAALRDLAKKLLALHRVFDTVGRYGGEEFAMVLPGCDQNAAAPQAERLVSEIRSRALDLSAGPLQVTLSVGAVSLSDAKGADASALLYAADLALVRAKAAGGNCVEFARSNEIWKRLSNELNEEVKEGPAADGDCQVA